jgi:hypothetical protein
VVACICLCRCYVRRLALGSHLPVALHSLQRCVKQDSRLPALLPCMQARFGRPSLATLYLRAMDSIHKVQPDAIFVLEVRRMHCYCYVMCYNIEFMLYDTVRLS